MRGRLPAALFAGIALFGAAMSLRGSLDPWWANVVVAALMVPVSLRVIWPRRQQLLRAEPLSLLAALILGIVLVGLTHLGFWLLADVVPALDGEVRGLYGEIQPAPPVFLVIPLVCLVVVAEELVWRGLGFAWCRAMLPRGLLVPGSVGLYALPQIVGGVPILVIVALGLGTVVTLQRLWTGEILSPLVTHAVWSVSIFVLVPLVP